MRKPADERAPAFQFYWKQWLSDDKVLAMTWEARAMHMHFICLAWQQTPPCTLPDDDELLCAWIGGHSSWEILKKQIFRAWRKDEKAGRWVQDGLLRVWKDQQAYRDSRRKNARARGKHMPSTSTARAKHKVHSPSPTPLTTTTTDSAVADLQPNWVSRIAAVWGSSVGHVSPGRVGSTLKVAVDRHGVERVERAMRGYVAVQKSDGKTCNIKWFADSAEIWIDRTKEPPAVIDGEMNATLELMTRPAKVVA